MRELGITGAVRRRKMITTIPDGSAECASDLLDRRFLASAPNRCRVVGFTYVKTWPGSSTSPSSSARSPSERFQRCLSRVRTALAMTVMRFGLMPDLRKICQDFSRGMPLSTRASLRPGLG